ncbi:hypothetical protein V3851_07680 [Paenibacillus sp. M1]|uniref:Transmembrane protein n=1 Tax=Paenibacillus haidiansis TaxID=1574488 RepID=A0ABU7VPL7_9BACL
MKRASIIAGVAIGFMSVLFLLTVCKGAEVLLSEGANHRQAWHQAAGHGHPGYPVFMKAEEHTVTETNPAWIGLLQIGLLICGAALFIKATGLLKWAGAAFAALCTMSLLTPLWGLVVLTVVFLLYLRFKNNRKYTWPQASGALSSSFETSGSRGRFLDEWERETTKED